MTIEQRLDQLEKRNKRLTVALTIPATYPGDPYSSADQRQLPGVSLLAGLQDQQIGS